MMAGVWRLWLYGRQVAPVELRPQVAHVALRPGDGAISISGVCGATADRCRDQVSFCQTDTHNPSVISEVRL